MFQISYTFNVEPNKLFVIIYFLDIVTGLMNDTVDSRVPIELYPYHNDGRDKLFPAWLIGVIVLSSVACIILVVTLIQRYLQNREEMRNNLHMMER